jgi:hypothetical protein
MDIPVTIFSAKKLPFNIAVSIGPMYKKSGPRAFELKYLTEMKYQ